MLKKLGITCVIAFAIIGHAEAKTGTFRLPVITDTVDIQTKDSSKQELPPSILSMVLKTSFISTPTLSNGINAAQLNPLAISFVEDYIGKFGKSMEDMKDWGKPYFDMMDGILEKHGLPKELKYLAVIESQLKFNAKSWAGAVGPWQLCHPQQESWALG
jgi:membrane-bound lytic murein transglycosylase D